MGLIEEHPVLEFSHAEEVTFYFDGAAIRGFKGEPIAVALHANGVRVYRHTSDMRRSRGFFCAIGKCSSCFMMVNGIPNVRTCVTPLVEGMCVNTQYGKGAIPINTTEVDIP